MQGSVPLFLRKNFEEKFGSFEGAVVNADIAGFTELTENLSSHGKRGVRIITFILDNFYGTVFKKAKKYGGYVISLSGDSYTAVFPGRNSLKKGINAGFEIKREIEGSKFVTPDGESAVFLRTAVSAGEISWFSFGKKKEEYHVFSGEPVFSVFNAQKKTPPGGFSVITGKAALSNIGFQFPIIGKIGKNIIVLGDKKRKRRKLFGVNDYAGSREGKPSSEFRHAGCVFIKIKRVKSENEALQISEDVVKMSSDFGGYINDIEATEDGIVYFILFGAPLSRSGDLRRAFEFMLALREKYPRNLSSSCVSGKIFAGYFSSGGKYRYAVNGEAINLSSRILKMAKTGDCLCEAQTAAGLKDKFYFKPSQKHKFKGIRDRVGMLNLVKTKKQKKINPRLHTRKDLILKISGIISGAKERKIIAVSGESGMGKSSVVDGLCAAFRGKTFIVRIKGDELKKDSFQPFKSFLYETLITSGCRTVYSRKKAFENKYSEIEDSFYSRKKNKAKALELKEELKSIKHFLGYLCGIDNYRATIEKIDPVKMPDQIKSSIISFLSIYLKGKRRLLFFDDADKLDSASADLIQKMLVNESFKKAVFVFASGKEISFLKNHTGIKTFRFKLGRLSREKTRYTAEAFFGRSIDGKLKRFIHEKSLGNPMILEELCRFLKISGHVIEKKRKLTFSGDEKEISGNMFSLIAGRIDKIEEKFRRTLNSCAVLGEEFEKDELVSMVNMAKGGCFTPETCRALDFFEKEKFIEYSRSKVRFRHSLIRDTVYEMLSLTSLESEHRFAAAALEKHYGDESRKQGEIAFHWEIAEKYEKAFCRWFKSAVYFRETYDLPGAVYSAEKALYCLEKCEKRDEKKVISLMCDISEDLLNNYSLLEAENYLSSSLERYKRSGVRDLSIIFRIYSLMGKLYKKKGNYETSLSYFRTAFKLWPLGVQGRMKREVFNEMGDVYEQMENFKKSLRLRRRCLYLVEKEGAEKSVEFEALNSIGSTLINLGELKEALKYLDKAAGMAKESGEIQEHRRASVLNNIGVAYYYLGEYEKSAFFNFGALDVFKKIYGHNNIEVAFLMSNIGGLLNKMRKYEEARKYLIRAADVYRKNGMSLHSDAIRVYVNLGYNHFSRKNYRRAVDCYRRVIELSKTGDAGENTDVAVSYNFLGKIETEKKKYDSALENFQRSLRIFNNTCGKESIYTAYVYGSMAKVYFYLSEKDKSLKLYKRSYDLFRKTFGDENEDSVFAAVSYAEALAKSGQKDSAEKVFESINKNEISDPELEEKIQNLSRTLLHK